MANLKDVIYLSAEDYNTLYTNGTVTINGVTLTYDANNIYIVPDNTQQQIDDILALIPSGATSSNKLATASDIPTIPTNVSAFNNDAGYLTSHQDISGKANKASITAGTAGTSSATSGSTLAVPYVTMDAQGIVTGYGTHTHTVTGFLTSHQDISGKAPNNHASSTTTYGVGTSSNYGHMKLGAANQNGATAANGVCAPNGHTHSQYLTSHQSLPFIGYIYVHYSQGQGDSNYCRLTNIMGTALSISTYSFANSNKEIRIQMSASKKYYVMITDQSAANYYNGTTNDNVNTDSSYNHSANASYYFKVQMNAAINTLRLLVIGI